MMEIRGRLLNKKTDEIPERAVYIGRPSSWGNPFVTGRDGTREQVVEEYRLHLRWRLVNGEIGMRNLAALHGKDLVCFCVPKLCHGHILQKAAAWALYVLQSPDLLCLQSHQLSDHYDKCVTVKEV